MTTKENDGIEDDGPSLESNSQEERIAARRCRIQRRIEAAKRDALGENLALEKSSESVKELRKSRKQIEESYQRLVKLQSDGTELVSNVQVAVDARETARRFEDDENKRQRIEKLETEAKASIMKFEEITSKWKQSWAVDSPQQLYEVFVTQKAACDNMIEEKNKLIMDLQLDLKSKDDRYVKDLRRQAEDIDLMVDRMEEQVKTLLRAYREELLQIESAFAVEREELIDSQRKRRDALEKQRKNKEVEYLDSREKRVDDLNNQLQVLRTQDAEEYNIVKIKLETDVQILEQNLQQMKATYQLNQEKLEYNFQVLKKRDEENTITKSQQKRKITRLQDLLNNLKQKLKRQEKQYGDDNQSLVDDLRRITEQYNELQKKFRHFQTTDSKKFNDIWIMNQQQAVEVARDLMTEDKIIHEQQLGLPWKDPDLEIMKMKGPPQSLKTKQRSATEVAQEVIGSASASRHGAASASRHGAASASRHGAASASRHGTASASRHGAASKVEVDTKRELPTELDQDTGQSEEKKDIGLSLNAIKQILDLLCNESGFLVESKLMKLLAPLDKEEQSLMKLDAIFNALGIDTEQDIHLLGRYFFETGQDEESDVMRKLLDKSVTAEELKAIMIHPTQVFKVLRRFVEENREPFRITRKQSVKLGITAVRDSSQDEAYWKQFGEVVAPKEERVWDALIDGFEKYSQVLTERATLLQDTEALQTQNGELRLLLRQYMNSKVNQELEIPPTQVLQMEMNR